MCLLFKYRENYFNLQSEFMSESNKKKTAAKQVSGTDTVPFSMPSLKDIVNGVVEDKSHLQNDSLSKKDEAVNDKVEDTVKDEIHSMLTDCEDLLQNLKALETGVKANVTIKVTEKCHRMMSELKLIDEFSDFRYSDIVEALLNSFIQKNKTELKKKISKRKSIF